MGRKFLNYFSDSERYTIRRLAEFRTRMVKPLLPILQALHLTPDVLSYLGLFLLVPVLIFFESLPLIAASLLFLYTVIDAIDGSYARLTGAATQGGALTDIVVDHVGLILVGLCSIHYGLVNPTLGAYYVAVYLVMIAFSVCQNALSISMQTIFRSKYFLYLIYLIWGATGFSLFNYLLPVFSTVHTVSCVQSFFRIKAHLNQSAARLRSTSGGGSPPVEARLSKGE